MRYIMDKKVIQPPQQNPKVVEDKIKKARGNLEVAVKEFLKILDDKVLEKNKSPAHKNIEKAAADDMVKAVMGLEQENVGEGILALGVTTLRTNLKLRDRLNEMEYLLLTTIKDLKTAEKQLGTKDDKPKGKS